MSEITEKQAEAVAALYDAPILSKYHGPNGFEVERFVTDYEAWSLKKRAAILAAESHQP